jgi:hypothetical protein
LRGGEQLAEDSPAPRSCTTEKPDDVDMHFPASRLEPASHVLRSCLAAHQVLGAPERGLAVLNPI